MLTIMAYTPTSLQAIDIWMSMCVVLVFAAMLEFAIVNTLARKEIRQMSMKARNTSAENDGVMPSDMVAMVTVILNASRPG